MGPFLWNKNKRTAESIAKGIGYFNQAIDRDPNYALAFAGLAESYVLLPWYGGMPVHEAFEKARAAATKALELDESLAEAHTAGTGSPWCSTVSSTASPLGVITRRANFAG